MSEQYFCPKVHKLYHIRHRGEITEYKENASCDECDIEIVLDNLLQDAVGFFHCRRCAYDICNKCVTQGLADITRRKTQLETSEPVKTKPTPVSSPSPSPSPTRLTAKATPIIGK